MLVLEHTNSGVASVQNSKTIFTWLKFVGIIGFLMMVSVCAVNLTKVPNISSWNITVGFLKSLGLLVLLAGASFMIGALTGFLFGIPKIIQNENNAGVVHNDNLVQVSDWLTKIIVGVGLTQIHEIPNILLKLGQTIQDNGKNDSYINVNTSVATIVYYTILGFACAYLWTRIYFTKILAENNQELIDINSRLREENEQKNKELKAIENSFNPKKLLTKEKDGGDTRRDVRRDSDKNITNIDPQKGKWGGKNEVNERSISAKVSETTWDRDLFVVELTVVSTNLNNPLTGEVNFHLHPTFDSPERTVKVENGMAKLELIAYGAFTIGAVCDDGKTKLELDLATNVPEAPEAFKMR